MSDIMFHLLDEVSALPRSQVEVLIPVIVSAFLREAPEGLAVPPSLDAVVKEFWAELGRANPQSPGLALADRLESVGLSATSVRALLAKAGTKLPTTDPSLLGTERASFEARAAPGPEATKAGPFARFSLSK